MHMRVVPAQRQQLVVRSDLDDPTDFYAQSAAFASSMSSSVTMPNTRS